MHALLAILMTMAPMTDAERQEKLARLTALEARLAAREAEDAEIKADLDKAQKLVPGAFFDPNPWQYRAITDMANGIGREKKQYTVAHVAGNRGGKTYLVPMIVGTISGLFQNRWFDSPLYKLWPFPKHIRCIGDKQLFMEGTGEFWKAIDTWFPKDEKGTPINWSSEKGDYSFPSRYYLPNGFVMDCITPEIKLRAHEGVALGMLCIIEPVEEEIWDLYPRAFDKGGVKLFSATLAHCSEWVDRRILQNPNAIITRGTALDNCEETVIQTDKGEVRGKLSREALQSMYDSMPEHDRDARWNGDPIYWRGRVLHEVWDDAVHIADDDSAPSRFPLYKVNIDPHPGKPWCIVVAGIDHDSKPWIVDEWPKFETFGRYYGEIAYDSPNHGERFYFELIRGLMQQYQGARLILDYKMSRTPGRTDEGTSTLLQRMADALDMDESEFERQNCNVGGVDGNGGNLLKSALLYDKSKPVGADNEPALRVLRRCQNTAYYLRNFTYRKSAQLGGFGTSEVYEQKFFDFPRGVMSLLSHDEGAPRIVSPSEARSIEQRDRERGVIKAARRSHPEWRGALAHV